MAEIRIDKISAARRQIDAAIRMTFGGEDPVAIHSVIAAANQIVRDLCARHGRIETYKNHFGSLVTPGHEKEFFKVWNASANFLKHADEDPDAFHDLSVKETDLFIVVTAAWYAELGNPSSPEMKVFSAWWWTQNPRVFKPDALAKLGLTTGQVFVTAAKSNNLPREQRLALGLAVLQKNRVVGAAREAAEKAKESRDDLDL
jgi:hypothetical protein